MRLARRSSGLTMKPSGAVPCGSNPALSRCKRGSTAHFPALSISFTLPATTPSPFGARLLGRRSGPLPALQLARASARALGRDDALDEVGGHAARHLLPLSGA